MLCQTSSAYDASIGRLEFRHAGLGVAMSAVASSDNPLKIGMRVHVGGRHCKFELHLPGACQARGESVSKEQGHVVGLSVLVSVGCLVHPRVWRFIPRTKDFDHLFLLADSLTVPAAEYCLLRSQPESPIVFRF